MIHVHVAVERNISSAVERTNKFLYCKKFPVSEITDTGLF